MNRTRLSRRTFLKGTGVLAGGLALGVHSSLLTVQNPAERPLLMAHYMPWYQTPEISGYWGWHWTMDHFDPSQRDENGRWQIAAQYIPLTGPYDSSDDAILEYQVLLMKLSGIDGVIIDWYGIDDFRDYAALNAATVKLFEHIKKAGLRFAICFEDQIYIHMTHDGYLSEDEVHANAQEVMRYMQEHWFSDDAYLKNGDQPVLFTFGPQYFRADRDWITAFEGLPITPGLVTLDDRLSWWALSSFPWPPMHFAGGIELGQAVLEDYLTRFYRNARRHDYIVGSAFPAFHDIYEEAGVRSSYGYIDPKDGETFRFTLDLALEANPNVIQLVTWNDYGEGTIIEPTEAFGYQYLEMVQETQRSLSGDAFTYTADDLRLPLQLFNFRKAHAEDVFVQDALDRAHDALIAGDTNRARSLISEFAE